MCYFYCLKFVRNANVSVHDTRMIWYMQSLFIAMLCEGRVPHTVRFNLVNFKLTLFKNFLMDFVGTAKFDLVGY